MRVYIALSFSEKETLQPVLNAMKTAVEKQGLKPFVFCEQYHFTPQQEQEMMRQAFADIDQSALLLAETTYKAIGIGVEAGYARAKGIPVVYIRQQAAPHSTTVAGASTYQLMYTDAADLEQQLLQVLAAWQAGS